MEYSNLDILFSNSNVTQCLWTNEVNTLFKYQALNGKWKSRMSTEVSDKYDVLTIELYGL